MCSFAFASWQLLFLSGSQGCSLLTAAAADESKSIPTGAADLSRVAIRRRAFSRFDPTAIVQWKRRYAQPLVMAVNPVVVQNLPYRLDGYHKLISKLISMKADLAQPDSDGASAGLYQVRSCFFDNFKCACV